MGIITKLEYDKVIGGYIVQHNYVTSMFYTYEQLRGFYNFDEVDKYIKLYMRKIKINKILNVENQIYSNVIYQS